MALPLIIQHLCFLFVLALPLLVSSQNANVSLGSSLAASDDNSWKSPSGDFAIGFRTTGNEELFLLAIWFDKIPEKTIVWYANGDKPAPKGSRLELTGDADFRLVDPKGQEIWKPESISAAYAAMLDSGNFVLVDRNSEYLWKSFKDPKDTILPTQELAIGGKLSSRKTEKDYSKGRFRLLMQTGGNLVLNSIALPTDFAYPAYFKSNTSDAADEMNSGYLFVFNTTGYLSIILRNRTSVSVTKKAVPQGDYYHRATLDPDGIFAQYAHTRSGSGAQNWFRIWSAPDDICSEINGDLGIGPCGFNSLCSLDANQRPDCECIPGFSLSDKSDKFSGCKQDRILNCDQGNSKPEDLYEMHGLPNAYWPTSANYEQMPQLNEQDCNISCLYDCNCLVAVIKGGNCWKKKLPLSNGRRDYKPYGKALIKVPKSDIPSNEPSSESNIGKKDQATLVLVGALLLGSSVFLNFLFVAAISLAILYVYPRRQNLVGPSSILETNLRAFTFKELKESTDGFREELGRGAFGTVFKGVLSSATTTSKYYVAVKKLDKVLQEGEREFKTEASAIAKTHHKNLVKLFGFCDENEHKLLVYEFMSNGTLASFLFGISRPDWNKRVQIALGIARGLTYLHEECSTQIIHCDIKPQNILLDESFTARISDFGLAKLMMSGQTRTQTVIRGTRGYVAPEWFRNTPITAKVDVYSYGVMLLEIICCRKSLAMEMENEEEVILTDWAYDCYKEGILNKLVENDEEARNDMKRAERLVMVAIWCIQEGPSLRPSMRMVTQMLEGVVQVSIPPCPSPFSSIC